ncbi:ribonuclease H-like domain-containing protein [Tanacetum coccineum]|uniref:Ribonuclease H-like domain-containing protein n=1 Tax=Tanacetum coccineum TaxID=301880 RepID=A0ABQ5I532_9ASTR
MKKSHQQMIGYPKQIGLDEYVIRKKIIESKTDTSKSKTSKTVDDEDDVIRVLTRTGLVNPVRPNGKRAVHTVSTARPISTARPVSTARQFAPKIAQTGSAIRPIYPRMDNVRPRASYSPIKRSYYTKPAFRPKNLKQDVKTSGVKNMTTAGTRAVVNTGKGEMDNDLKKSRWVWRPKGNYMDHGNPESILQDHAVVDSGCSSHMTGNKTYLSDYKDYNRGFMTFGSDPKGGKITGKCKIRTANLDFDDVYFVDELKFNLFSVSQMCDKKNSIRFTDTECLIMSPSFKLLDESQVVLRTPRQNRVYSLDLKNIVPSGGITCLYANATTDKSKLWHMRLGHMNFKNINKLVKGHLVRVLPSKVFVNDHTCVACKKGKQHKASYKAKLERTIRLPLELLHMDLFGSVSVESISLENQLNHKVKIIRSDHGTEFKNHAMNELCAKKGIKREFSVARTLQQNGKPHSISFMRPFGCSLTILNTLDPLDKFDGKSDEGYLLGYSTSSKAFRVYNKTTKRVEENMHIDFLEDQPNVAGSGPDWMFDLDFLTNTMNYILVSVENHVNVDACTQEHYVAGSSEKDKEPTQEYILLPLHPHRPRISVEDVVQAAQEKPSENSPKDNDVQDSEDVAEKEEQHTLTEAEQALKDDLERMIAQEIAAKAIDDATRQAFEEEKKRAAQATSINKLNTGRPSVSTSNSPLVSTANTPYASAASTPTGANTGGSSFVYLGGQIPIDASTLPNVDLPIDPNMPDLEDDSNVFPNDGIFSGAYDDEDVGAEADFNNMDNTIDVSPIHTLRVHKDHLKDQILGDPKSAVQTRGKIQKASSVQQALDKSWVEAMQEELLQFKLQKVWILIDLPFRKKVIGTKWVFKNKRDDRSIVMKNKARLLAQGFRLEEGIDYDEVFALVAKIEAIRLFLAFASFMGFPVYQMDVKSAFLYGTIEEEVYVHQPPSFVDPAYPKQVYKVVKALYGLHQAPKACQDKYVADILKKFDFCSIKTATTLIVSNKPLVKDEDGVGVDVHIYRSMIGSLMYLTASRPDIMFTVCACARDSPFKLEAFSNSDYGGASLDRKSTTGGCQFLGRRLISWQCKKQTIVANFTTEAEYVTAANYCGQVLWIQNQMMDYGFNFRNTKIHIENESTTCIVKNPVYYSRTKHIKIRHHFIRDYYEKRLIDVIKIHTDANVADLLTKGFDVTRFNFLVANLVLLGKFDAARQIWCCQANLVLSGKFGAARQKFVLFVTVTTEQPLPATTSPTAQSPDYVLESDPKADPEEDDDEDPEKDSVDYPTDRGDDGDDEDEPSDDDEDEEVDIEAADEEEEEHPALADSTVGALPAADQAPSMEETESFETDESATTPPPHPTYRVTARISIPAPVHTPVWSDAEVARLLAISTPPSSPLSHFDRPFGVVSYFGDNYLTTIIGSSWNLSFTPENSLSVCGRCLLFLTDSEGLLEVVLA